VTFAGRIADLQRPIGYWRLFVIELLKVFYVVPSGWISKRSRFRKSQERLYNNQHRPFHFWLIVLDLHNPKKLYNRSGSDLAMDSY